MTLLWLSSECGRGENAPILPSFVVVQGPRTTCADSAYQW